MSVNCFCILFELVIPRRKHLMCVIVFKFDENTSPRQLTAVYGAAIFLFDNSNSATNNRSHRAFNREQQQRKHSQEKRQWLFSRISF